MQIIFSSESLSKIFCKKISNDAYDICLDSKKVKNGDIFIAFKGESVDGHDFIPEAIANGASLIISEKEISSVDDDKIVVTSSSYESLMALAKFKLNCINAKYICITGSVGKTTTKDMISHILRSELKENIYASKKNFNSRIGLPICAAIMPMDSKFGIFEMGMSASGDIRHLTEIINPNVSIITDVNAVHLEYFDSIIDIAKAKSEILEKSSEYAIIPLDSPFADFLKNKALEYNVKNIITFGADTKADACICSCEYNEFNTVINSRIFGKEFRYKLNTINNSLAINSVIALSAAHASTGIDVSRFVEHIESFEPANNRGGVTYLRDGSIILVDDSYNASPISMKSALHSIERFRNKRKIAVLGDMLELGKDEIFFHENLSATIDKCSIDLVFTCGELSNHLYDNLQEFRKGCHGKNCEEIVDDLLEEIREGDCILVKGSRSMKMENIVSAIKNKFVK
jgi:UDP-N-acetylmuramoyl-tripeptide--D-alanyl-D-alanine ligase